MEELRRAVVRIAATPDSGARQLPLPHRLLLPFLSASSAVFLRLSALIRHLTRRHRLPVGVISVGNLTWGGNGKTPMVEYLARRFDAVGISPLILTRGYGGGDESRMLQRRATGTTMKVAESANRAAAATYILNRFGYVATQAVLCNEQQTPAKSNSECAKVGLVILDDGMQHWSLLRDVELVMINSLMPWGNKHIIPRGPMREPLDALSRADIIVLHHADLADDMQLRAVELTIKDSGCSCPVFYSRLSPSYIFDVRQPWRHMPLNILNGVSVLCVSAIGYPDAFVKAVQANGAKNVDRLDFSDHHPFSCQDIKLISEKVQILAEYFHEDITLVVTEKDFDRDPSILKELQGLQVWVLSSTLQIMPRESTGEAELMAALKGLLTKSRAVA